MSGSIYDAVTTQLFRKLRSKNVRRKIVDEVVEPILDETKKRYSAQITFTQIFMCSLFLLLIINLYYSIQLNDKLK